MKKTIQRVLAAVILFAMILSGGFSEVGKVHAEKQQGTTKRAIYVVFDNSGSMYVCMGTATKHGLRRLMRWKFLPR